MEEIEKLRVRVEKDPNSRLFLPLAEEYRKSGLLDEAISVILRGLERQPGYTSARVALGRLYLEKNMPEEAKHEFEAVVKAIPDNLFAHKKLAEMYRDAGEIEKAIAEYETVVRLNPIDDDAKMCLAELGAGGREEGLLSLGEAEMEVVPETPVSLPDEQAVADAAAVLEETPAESAEEAPAGEKFVDEFEEFKASFSGIEDESVEEAEEAQEVPQDQVFELSEESPFENVFAGVESESREESKTRKEPPLPADSGAPDISKADSFIQSGNYFSALETYKDILTREPDNKQALQRMVELKALMKLTGKDGEALVARLETFLEAIKRGFPKRL